MAFIGGFHGRTFGALSLTGSKPVQRHNFAPLLPEITHVPFADCYRCPFKMTYPECGMYCVDFIEDMYFKKFLPPEEVAALFFEPIQGEGGYVVPPDDYFLRVKNLMDKYGILMVADEVQSGMGRTGRWFASEHFNIQPDILCTSKAVASGLPLGVTVSKSELMDWERGSHASTFGGNPVCCAAANAVIDVIRGEDLLAAAEKKGKHVLKRLKELQEDCELIGDVRGKGLMIGVELVRDRKTKEPAEDDARKVMTHSWKKGVAVITAGHSTIRIAPPLNTSMELLEKGLDIIEESLIAQNKEM
jgi:4-aminobutyrate aminotransferase